MGSHKEIPRHPDAARKLTRWNLCDSHAAQELRGYGMLYYNVPALLIRIERRKLKKQSESASALHNAPNKDHKVY